MVITLTWHACTNFWNTIKWSHVYIFGCVRLCKCKCNTLIFIKETINLQWHLRWYTFILLQTLILCERMNEWTLHFYIYILHMHIAFLILTLHRFQNNYGHGASSTNTKEKKARRKGRLLVENMELGVEEWCFS